MHIRDENIQIGKLHLLFFHVRSTDTELCELPAQWLQTLLEDLTSDSPSEALCGTRRSAGVPFFIQVSSVITLIVSLI